MNVSRFAKTPIFDRDGTQPVSNAVFTIPNLLTLLRMLCIPFFLWLMHIEKQPLEAALLLIVLGSTDWIDGYLARLLNQRTRFGRIFDPTVDRLMFVVIITSMIVARSAPLWFLFAVFIRDVLVSSVSLFSAIRAGRTLTVSWWGKTATFGLLLALPALLAISANPPYRQELSLFAWAIAIPSLILSWLTAGDYLYSHWKARQAARSETAQGISQDQNNDTK